MLMHTLVFEFAFESCMSRCVYTFGKRYYLYKSPHNSFIIEGIMLHGYGYVEEL